MDKNELKSKLAEVKAQIKANSKDAHFADTLISELLSVHGELKHEPTLVHIPLSEIEDKAEGETFVFATTKSGESIYHTTAGYTVIAPSGYTAMFDVIKMSIDYMNENGTENLAEDDKDVLENDILATTYILSLPSWALADTQFKYDVAGKAIDYLNEQVLKSEEELQPETPEENKAFEEAVKGLETVKEALNEEMSDRKD